MGSILRKNASNQQFHSHRGARRHARSCDGLCNRPVAGKCSTRRGGKRRLDEARESADCERWRLLPKRDSHASTGDDQKLGHRSDAESPDTDRTGDESNASGRGRAKPNSGPSPATGAAEQPRDRRGQALEHKFEHDAAVDEDSCQRLPPSVPQYLAGAVHRSFRAPSKASAVRLDVWQGYKPVDRPYCPEKSRSDNKRATA
jgi:hypothetical protein